MKNLLFILVLSFSFISCDELTGASTGANDISIKKLLGDISFVKVASDKFRLNGVAENGGVSAHSYSLRFEIAQDDSVEFYFHSRVDLSGGVVVNFSRVSSEMVRATFSLNGIEDSIEFESATDSPVSVIVDIHNNESDAHLLMWKSEGPFGVEDCTEEETCLFNSDRFDTVWGSHGRASGSYWGVNSQSENILKLEGPNETIFDH